MHCRWQAITHHWHRTVVLFSVALLIAWNFATIAHQLDLIPEHHSEHHCQMFAGAHQGLAKAQPELSTPTFSRLAHVDVAEITSHLEDVTYTARAPPNFAF
ncbi:DUF2607 family protein [Vibrio jasicida]|uniref:DUF2607 family protein n=1 Tax=Vibrio jasicida TaxID=766224 RepID=UPI0040691E95